MSVSGLFRILESDASARTTHDIYLPPFVHGKKKGDLQSEQRQYSTWMCVWECVLIHVMIDLSMLRTSL